MVDCLPLVVVVVFVVHRSMDYWLAQINEEKHRNCGEHKAYVVP
jgi:hypothetical protein